MTLRVTRRSLAVTLLFVSVPASASAGADTKTLPAASPTALRQTALRQAALRQSALRQAASGPAASLSVSPSRVRLVPGARGTIHVTNAGNRRVLVVAGPAGYALDLRGRPQIVGRRPGAALLMLRPSRFVLGPGATARVLVTAAAARRLTPGDHPALVLFEARAAGATRGGVALRLGVVVDVRAAGVVVRRVDIRAVRVRQGAGERSLEVVLANRGNVSEVVTPRRLSVVLRRRGRVVATVRPASQTLLPRTTGVVDLRYRGKLRGPVTAIVTLAAANGRSAARRHFPLRL